MAEAKRRPVRPSALRAQQTFVTNGAPYHDSDADDDMDNRPATRTSRRLTKVDLAKLDTLSLQRYHKYYKLAPAAGLATKEELVPSVSRHFAQQVVDEETVILQFVLAVQRHSKQQTQLKQQQQQLQMPGMGMMKKPTQGMPVMHQGLPPKGMPIPKGGPRK